MHEILFKAKRIDNGEWVEGYLFETQENTYIVYNNQFDDDLFLSPSNIFIVVDANTICQYTGLTDKNGCKIWEGDVCDRHEKYPEIVKYRQGDYVLDYSYAFGKDSGFNYCNLGFYVCERGCVEVIGNIFDNPELLEAGEANE